jgi:MFS family permease
MPTVKPEKAVLPVALDAQPFQPRPERATRARYNVLGLSFLMAFVMYMERGAIGVATPMIMRDFHIDKVHMGWSVSAFNWSYAAFQVPGGWLADKLGSRLVLAGSMAWWAVFTATTGATRGAGSLAITRFLFGMGEAAAFPAGSRSLVSWLPVRRRAFGQGFQHCGARLGAALAPILVTLIIANWGWRPVFYMFGAFGILWSIVWYSYYRNRPDEHSGVSPAELDLIERDHSAKPRLRPPVPWKSILRRRDIWYLSAAYFCYGWVLWLYLAWFPTYLREERHFTALNASLASLPLLAATVTNVAGGVISDALVSRWRNLRRGRLAVSVTGFLIAALALLPGVLTGSAVGAIACLTVALAGLELTVAVSWALSIDLGGEFSGSVSSVMNTWGNIGGAISAVMVGYLATLLGWTSPFILASGLCFFSAILVTRIDPRHPIRITVLREGSEK